MGRRGDERDACLSHGAGRLRAHERRAVQPRTVRREEVVGAELGADGVIVTMDAARSSVLAFEHGAVRAIRSIQERNEHAERDQQRRQKRRQGTFHGIERWYGHGALYPVGGAKVAGSLARRRPVARGL